MELSKLNIVCLIFNLIIVSQASKEQLSRELNEMIHILNNIQSEQIERANSIIGQKKELAKEKGKAAVKCCENEGNKYLQQIENNNTEYTSAFLEKLNGYKNALENGNVEEVEQAMKGTLKSEFQSVLTNMQAQGESITLAFVARANQCMGLDH